MQSIIESQSDSKKYCFFDLETCNLALNECHNLPWQAACITLQRNKILKELDYLIKWPQGIIVSQGAAITTRYNPDLVDKYGKSPEEVYEAIYEEIKNADVVIGHNIGGFDIYVLNAWFRKIGKPEYNFAPKMIDTLAIARGMKLENTPKNREDFVAWQYRMLEVRQRNLKCSLGALGKEFNIEHDYDNLHNALVDLHLNIKVWNQLRYSFRFLE